MARTLAERKAVAVAGRLALPVADGPVLVEGTKVDATTVVVGCDTVLSFAGEVRGKPGSPAQAAAWWRSYRAATGTLVTGHAVVEVASGDQAVGAAATIVRFGAPSDAEIAASSPPASRWRWPAASRSTATAARSSTASTATTAPCSACRCRCSGRCSATSAWRWPTCGCTSGRRCGSGPLAVSPPVVLAPMAGITNAPFRRLCRGFGAVALPRTLDFEHSFTHAPYLAERM